MGVVRVAESRINLDVVGKWIFTHFHDPGTILVQCKGNEKRSKGLLDLAHGGTCKERSRN